MNTIKNNNVAIGIEKINDGFVLLIGEKDGKVDKVASFENEEKAKKFETLILKMINRK